MSLLELKNFIQHAKSANISQLAGHLRREPEVVRTMLAHWIRKGMVQQCKRQQLFCGTKCQKCDPTLLEAYEWVGKN
jgi:hypothetical protein